ncbi:MAG: efflux RND transporter permease subunit [Rikenellaceae bacterium]
MIKRLIERPIAVTMCVIAFIVLGFISLRYLPVSLMPDVDIPKVSVHVSSPGMSVREINNTLLRPLKSQLSQVIGLSEISTEARSDAGVVHLSFEPSTDMDIAFIEVNEKMDRAYLALPEGTERPKIVKANVTDIPAFYLDIMLREESGEGLPQAGVDFTDLGEFTRDVIAKRIEQLEQTAIADVSGVISPELLCIPDIKRLNSMGEDVEFLSEAIESNNLSLSALSIKDGEYRYNIQFNTQIASKEDIENIYINHNGRIYQFKELCTIIEQPSQRSGLVRSGKQNALSIAIIKQSDARMEDLQESINTLVTQMEKEYPNVRFELSRDQTKLLSYSISSLSNNLIAGAVLACFVIFFFMGDLRSPLLIIITIPLSLIVTLLAFYAFGISINIISLSGLILGVGMMVDNSIIVIDNIVQRWSSGMNLKEAISKAVGEVFTPMLSSILTTCSVFLPLIFLSGVAGALFYDQAMAVTIALFSSLLVSVLVLPVYFYALYRKRESYSRLFGDRVNLLAPYEAILKWTLRHAKVVYLCFFLLIPATYFIYQRIEKSSLPPISYDDTIVQIDWNSGISLVENDARTAAMLESVEQYCEQTTSMVGVQQFMMSHTPSITTSESIVYIKANSVESLESVEQGVEKFLSEKYPQASATFSTSGNIFDMIFADTQSDLVVSLKPRNGGTPEVADVIHTLELLQESLPNINISTPALEENIIYVADTEKMALYGLTYNEIYAALRNMVSQNSLFQINRGGYTVPVVTGYSRAEVEDILSSKVRTKEGVEVSLSLIIDEQRGEDFKLLYSNSGGDYYPIYINAPSEEIEQIIERIEECLQHDSPMSATFSGGYFSSREMILELTIILLIAISLLYFILAAQFESVIQPLIILLELMIDIFFVMAGLWILGESLNLMSLIGIVVMSGIIINDSILKVDTINRLRREGMPLLKAIFTAGQKRLKPIIMTSLTTILAITPFLRRVDMGSDLQYPLSLALIIGMAFGTMVSLFFIPLVYHTIYRKRG